MVWKIYDVGGARNQRQAWAPYFQDSAYSLTFLNLLYPRLRRRIFANLVNAIIFLAPISAFDQVLAEDPRVNRLEDSLLLWRGVVSNKLLAHVNLILFLNKCDLLKVRNSFAVRGQMLMERFFVSIVLRRNLSRA